MYEWLEDLEPRCDYEWEEYITEHIWKIMTNEFASIADFLEATSDSLYDNICNEMINLFMEDVKNKGLVIEEEEE